MVLVSDSINEEIMIKVRDPAKVEDPTSIDDSLVWVDMVGEDVIHSLGISLDTAKELVIELLNAIVYLQKKDTN